MLDVRSILHEMGYTNLREDGAYYRAKPLYRDSRNPTSLRINKKTGSFADFSANINGTLADLVKLTTGKLINFDDLAGEVEEDHGIIKTTTNVKREWEGATLVKSYNFYLERGISRETQEKFGVRLCQSGKMTRRMVFPVYDDEGLIIGIDGRTIFDATPKWKKLGYKLDWIFPLFAIPEISKTGEVILVESIGDTLALYDAGIKNVFCLFSVKISSKVISKLIELGVKKIIIATNNDKDNEINPRTREAGNQAAIKIREKLLNFFDDSVIHIKLPIKKDFGVMSKDEIKLWQ